MDGSCRTRLVQEVLQQLSETRESLDQLISSVPPHRSNSPSASHCFLRSHNILQQPDPANNTFLRALFAARPAKTQTVVGPPTCLEGENKTKQEFKHKNQENSDPAAHFPTRDSRGLMLV